MGMLALVLHQSPLKVENWHVPIPLIDLKPQWNWDLSMAKVSSCFQTPFSLKLLAY